MRAAIMWILVMSSGACAVGEERRDGGELRGPGIEADSEPVDSDPADSEGVRLDLPAFGSTGETPDESSSTADGSTTSASSTSGESSTGDTGSTGIAGTTGGEDLASTGGDSSGSESSGGAEGTSTGESSGGGTSTGEPEPEPEPEPPAVCGDGVCSGSELVTECWKPGVFCQADCSKRPDCLTDCPCAPGVDNVCKLAPGTCSAVKPGGVCDPNGDGQFQDGDWTLGWKLYQAKCS